MEEYGVRYLAVDGRDDLAAVTPIQFITVIVLRVVAGGDHNSSDTCLVLNGEGYERCGHYAFKQVHSVAAMEEDSSYGQGKRFRGQAKGRHGPMVIPDHYPRLLPRAPILLLQYGGKALVVSHTAQTLADMSPLPAIQGKVVSRIRLPTCVVWIIVR